MVHQIRTNQFFFLNDVDVAVTFMYNLKAQNYIWCKTQSCWTDKTQNYPFLSVNDDRQQRILESVSSHLEIVWHRNAQLLHMFKCLRFLDLPFV